MAVLGAQVFCERPLASLLLRGGAHLQGEPTVESRVWVAATGARSGRSGTCQLELPRLGACTCRSAAPPPCCWVLQQSNAFQVNNSGVCEFCPAKSYYDAQTGA
jgi:hypothetical protein